MFGKFRLVTAPAHIETDLKHAATLRMSRPYYLGQCNARLRCQNALVAAIAVIFRLLTNL